MIGLATRIPESPFSFSVSVGKKGRCYTSQDNCILILWCVIFLENIFILTWTLRRNHRDSGISGAGADCGWRSICVLLTSWWGGVIPKNLPWMEACALQWLAPTKSSLCYFSTEPVQGSVALLLCNGVMGWWHFKISLIADIYSMPHLGTVLSTRGHYLISSPHQPWERGVMTPTPVYQGRSYLSLYLASSLEAWICLGSQEPCLIPLCTHGPVKPLLENGYSMLVGQTRGEWINLWGSDPSRGPNLKTIVPIL